MSSSENSYSSSFNPSLVQPSTEEPDRHSIANNQSSEKIQEQRPFLFSPESAAMLKQYQREIYELTDVTPSFRRLVNALVTIENLEKVKSLLVSHFK